MRAITVENRALVRRPLESVYSGLVKARDLEPLEVGQVYTRFAVGIVISVYVVISYLVEGPSGDRIDALLVLLAAAWLSGFAFLFHISLFPARHLERRIASINTDAIAISLLLHFGDKSSAIFFPVYLWVTLGNGFRFGISYMYLAMAANGLGFAVMVAETPYWRDQWQFSVGLFVAIIAIPLYVARLIQRLRSAMVEAKAASTAKTSFLSVMSHELRTPLNAILGLAQLSKAKATTGEEHTNAVWTELAAQRLMRMVETILNFQRVEVGATQAQLKRLNMLDVIYEAQAVLHPLALRKKLKLYVVFDSEVPPLIHSDKNILETIVINLCTNAIKYTKQGVVTLKIGMERGAADNATLRIEVKDTGTGIDPAFRPYIFDRFTRGKISEADDEGGAGLGLSLCKALTEMLRGVIDCSSTPGQGSTFSVEIPVTILDADDNPGLEAEAEADRASPSGSIVVLGDACPRGAFDGAAAASLPLQWLSTGEVDGFLEQASTKGDLSRDVIVFDPAVLTKRSREILASLIEHAQSAPGLVLTRQDGRSGFPGDWPSAHRQGKAETSLCGLAATVLRWNKLNASLAYENRVIVMPERKKLRVLIADDNKLNLEVVRRMLEMDGHTIIEANRGEEALDCLLARQSDIAVLDINMPDLDGIEITKLYRMACAGDAMIPLVALTADTSEALHAECLRAGMAKVLCKPVSLAALRDLLAHTTLPAAPPMPKSARAETGAPVADRDRIDQLTELFGPKAFAEELLPKFESEMHQSLNKLRQAVSQSRLKDIRATLHAIKSIANTIGAARLSESVSQIETSNAAGHKGAYSELKGEMSRYLEAARMETGATLN